MKTYQQGEKVQVYLNKSITPDFLEWINKQSDLSNFFLYAAQQLYEKTGFIDVSDIMPRKINFDIVTNTATTSIADTEPKIVQPNPVEPKPEAIEVEEPIDEPIIKSAWESFDDDPFA